MYSLLMKPTNKPRRLRDYKVKFHFSGVQHHLKSQQVSQEFNRVPPRLLERQPVSRQTRLHLHQQQPPSQLQRARRIPTPSLALASVIGVENLSTDLMNALEEASQHGGLSR